MFRIFMRSLSTSNILRESIKPPIRVFGIEGRYVTALYSAASQKSELDQVDAAFQSFIKILSKPSIKDFIDTSMISRNEKAKLLGEAAKSASMPSTAANFLAIVAENGRLRMLRKMLQIFHSVMVAHRKEALCEVITAQPLDNDDRKALTAALEKLVKGGKKIQLTEKVEPSIIGGLIVGIDDKHIDMSLAARILYYTELMTKGL